MQYHIKDAKGRPLIYANNINGLTKKVIAFLIIEYQKEMFALSIPIFNDKNKIVEKIYFKEIPYLSKDDFYLCLEKYSTEGIKTYRTYYPLGESLKRASETNEPTAYLEVFSMRNKQLLAKDCY